MDEHKSNGMTEFLRREVAAWEDTLKERMREMGKGRRKRMWVVGMIVAILLLAVAAACVVVPAAWENKKPPAPDATEQNGILPPTGQTDTQADETDGGSEESQGEPEVLPTDPYAYDFSIVPAGATPIVPKNLATKNHPVNQTDRVIDMQSVMAAACQIPAASGQISVLIIHTHTGEGYNREDALYLDADDEEFARSADGSDGVVAVGARLAQRLNEAGIGTIHCRTVFDGESNRESYSRAADAIDAFRLAYPSLLCVIDVHRAATVDEQGNIVRSIAVHKGQGIAQTQVICGMSAEQTSKTNLALAMTLQERMNAAVPDSCAAVICKEQTLNQGRAPFVLTLEIGSCGNTLVQALDGAEVVAGALCTLFDTN